MTQYPEPGPALDALVAERLGLYLGRASSMVYTEDPAIAVEGDRLGHVSTDDVAAFRLLEWGREQGKWIQYRINALREGVMPPGFPSTHFVTVIISEHSAGFPDVYGEGKAIGLAAAVVEAVLQATEVSP